MGRRLLPAAKPMLLARLSLLLLICRIGFGEEARWPQFRGPGGAGVGAGDIPTFFGPKTNLLWRTSLPPGHSSPCIWDECIFLTGFANGELQVVCLNRGNGKLEWRRALRPGKIERSAHLSDPATATPATDGTNVFVYFGSFGLAAFDFAGNAVWQKPLPIPITQHGAGTSPVVTEQCVILNCDQDTESYLLAVDKRNGQTFWKIDRPGFKRGFATPLLWPANGPREVVIAGTLRLVGYDLETGRENWSVGGLPNEIVTTPVCGEGLIYVAAWTSGSGVARMPAFDGLLAQGDADHDGKLTRAEAPVGPAKQHFLYMDANKDGFVTRAEYETIAAIFDKSKNIALAVRPGGHGNVTETNVVWKHSRGLPYCPSPLYYEHKLYLVKNGGLATCLNAETGAPFYEEERLGALGDYYSSPVAANGKICVISQGGVAVIYRADEALDVLARNPLDETVVATPAIVDGKLYVRTGSAVCAFGSKN